MKIKQYKIARRVGARIFPKTENPKFILMPKQIRGRKRPRPASEFGLQLLEKQKARYCYGLRERQFARYVKLATSNKEINPAEFLYRMLETRLDNVVYQLGFSKTRRGARQIISHGHVVVNEKRVTIPSYLITKGDRVGIRRESQNKIFFQHMKEANKEHKAPEWLFSDIEKGEGLVNGVPMLGKHGDTLFSLTSVIEFYSR